VATALLVIDVQEEALERCPDGGEIVARINELSRRAAEAGLPVIFIQHEEDEEYMKGTPGWELAGGLERTEGSLLVPKTYRDAFETTDLEPTLRRLGVTHVVVTGVHSDYCVQTTALSALIRGFDLTFVSDCHAARDSELPPHQIQALINSRFQTLRYPGRTVEVVPAAEVTFEPAPRARREAPSAT
jgi:nicotinamidase-related amidase